MKVGLLFLLFPFGAFESSLETGFSWYTYDAADKMYIYDRPSHVAG